MTLVVVRPQDKVEWVLAQMPAKGGALTMVTLDEDGLTTLDLVTEPPDQDVTPVNGRLVVADLLARVESEHSEYVKSRDDFAAGSEGERVKIARRLLVSA